MNLKKLLLVSLTSFFMMGSFVASINIFESKTIKEASATTDKIVFIDKSATLSWWDNADASTYIRQSHTADGTSFWHDTLMTRINDAIWYGTLNSASEGFEFFVYSSGPAQNNTVFFGQAIVDDIRANTYNFFKPTSTNGESRQTGDWTAGSPTETFVLSKHIPGTLGRTTSVGTFAKYFPTLPAVTTPSVTGFTFIDWFLTTSYTLGDTYNTLQPYQLGIDRTIFAKLSANYNEDFLRIPVVRPGDTREGYVNWNAANAYQVLRIANTQAALTNNTQADITVYEFSNFISDTYYDKDIFGDGTFNEYDADGIVFYDVPVSAIVGKYFDLVRYNPNDTLGIPWNKTSSYLFTTGLNNGIFRIFGNGTGIVFPSGISAESRNISDASVAKILEGYLTCNDSTSNGYQAFKNLNENFNLLSRTSSSETLNDYDFDTFTNYGNTRGAGETTTIANKIVRMQAEYNGANPLNPINSAFNPSITNQTQTQGIHNTLLLLSLIILAYLTFKKLVILNN
jgi:hypothetical protein